MGGISRVVVLVLVSACVGPALASGAVEPLEPLDSRERTEWAGAATGSSYGVGLDVSWLDLRADIDGQRLRGDGGFAGFSGWRQWDSEIRVEGRVLGGRMGHDVGNASETASALLAEFVATLGYAAGPATRIHIGLGYRRTDTAPVANGKRVTDELLVPIGVMHSRAMGEIWTALLRADLVSLLTAREHVEGVGSIEDETFRRTGGVEVRLSATFHRGEPARGLAITPQLRYAAQGDTEEMRVDGEDRAIEDASTTEIGVQFVWFL